MRSLACTLIVLAAAPAFGQDTQEEPRAPLAEPLAYSKDGRSVRLVPLRPGRLPDLETGQLLRPTCGVGVDLEQAVRTRWLPNGDLLARRAGTQPGWSRFSRDARGGMKELATGLWPAGWNDAGSSDVNGDELDDLLLTRKVGKGYTPFEYRIAFGTPNGSFDFQRAQPVRVCDRMWAAVFTLGDMDGDGRADLVYHSQPHGGSHPVTLYVLKGNGDGSFAPETKRRVLLKGPAGASMTGIVLNDFDRDGRLDVFLPPDDDVPDEGQAYYALNSGAGMGELVPTVDFEPKREGPTSDRGHYVVQTCDVDLDGNEDLIVWFHDWNRKHAFEVKVHWGDSRGNFGNAELLLQGQTQNKPTMSWRLTAVEW